VDRAATDGSVTPVGVWILTG
jgi:Protein of unknown function (DUF2630)